MENRGPVKIGDIAQKAGVSIATVSRVLNNSDLVTEKTGRRVRRVIKELGYIPNETARSLVRRKSRTVAILLPDVSNPFYADVFNGANETLSASGYCIFLCSTNYVLDNERRFLQEMAGRGVDGVILVGLHMRENDLPAGMRSKISFVAFQTQLPGVDAVATDDSPGFQSAIEHLMGLGHRKIGLITLNSLPHTDRFPQYRATLEKWDIPFRQEYICETLESASTPQQGYRAAKRLLALPDPPTALLALNDYVAQGVYLAARELGLRIPEDLSVVGFDDIVLAQLLNPALTTVRQPGLEAGRTAAELMLRSIGQQGRAGLPRTVLLPTEFIQRDSTAPPRH